MSQFHIFQTDADYKFCSFEEAKEKFSLEDYKKIFSGELIDKIRYAGKVRICDQNDLKVLEELYIRFNVQIPKEYTGRSLSTSDVVQIVRGEESKYYYCDRFGWIRLQI